MIKDYTGCRFGRLTVLSQTIKLYSGRYRVLLHCVCDCGKYKDKFTGTETISCGCAKVKTTKKRKKLREHWRSMKQRCSAKEGTRHFKWYGGNGINVCVQWQDFENFYNDMEASWSEGLELDRIENTKGYYKENCRWVTHLVQQRNKKNSKLTEKQVSEIRSIYGIQYKQIAKMYNVDASHISLIKRNMSWKIE